jgi:hypothetical protein
MDYQTMQGKDLELPTGGIYSTACFGLKFN